MAIVPISNKLLGNFLTNYRSFKRIVLYLQLISVGRILDNIISENPLKVGRTLSIP